MGVLQASSMLYLLAIVIVKKNKYTDGKSVQSVAKKKVTTYILLKSWMQQ